MFFKEERSDIKFGFSTMSILVMGFCVIILGYRVIAHTLEPKENYKKLPLAAKERKGKPG